MPIREVNVNRQTISIKGRIVQKSSLQTLRSGLKFFHLDIIDKDNDVIRIKFWRQKAEEYYNILHHGSVYILKCTGNDVVVSNTKFNDTSNPYEINFSDRCLIKKAENDDDSIGKAPKYIFSTIKDIKEMPVPSIVDLIGIVRQFSPCTKVISRKNNDEVSRRTISIVDKTCFQINITLWGELAEVRDEKLSGNPVVALKSIQIRDYQGRQGSTLNGRSNMEFSIDDEKMEELRGWFNDIGNTVKFESISNLSLSESPNSIGVNEKIYPVKTLKDIRNQMEDNEFSSVQSFQVIARISKIGSINVNQQVPGDRGGSLTYDACPICKKKVLFSTSYCEKCDESVIPETKFLFPVTIEDHTCSLTVQCFHEIGSIFIKELNASNCKEMEQNNDKKLNFILNLQCMWRHYNLKIQLKAEEYNNQKKTRAIIQSAEPINLDQISSKMLESINQSLLGKANKRSLYDENVNINKRISVG
ncbi:replication protein a large subunit [Cryptosporidium ubiquitum]|uniref:Replication protein a large subunit n=1 Tax=Cryptosporidium ubiquitum TaxID=857276 RepID=A0A1J4MMU4_9CRYT|nr:replication protein a large subunit [Cryptosporidium ubiquitum]OII74189.1 replication protein a large subunit [Cryptosporidium ubiquitum]